MSDSKLSRNWVADHIARLPRSGIRDFFELVNTMDDVISLGIGEPDFATPWHIREATIYAIQKGFTSYTSNLGYMPLRRSVCRYVAERFGPSYDPATECIITVGVSEGLDLALRAILNPGDEVVYHEPCYVSYAPSIAMAHAIPVAVVTKEETQFALDPAAMEAAITPKTKVMLLNFPNNPTGAGLTADQIKTIAVPKIPDRMALLASGELKAGVLPDPLASLAVGQGAVIVADDSTHPEFGFSVISFRKAVIDANPEAIKGFLAAIEEATALLNADAAKYANLLSDQKLVPPPLIGKFQVPPFPIAGVPTEAEWNDALAWAKGKGMLTVDVSYADSVNATLLP